MKDLKAKFKTEIEVKEHLQSFDTKTQIAVILSEGFYYVDSESGMVRVWETLIHEGSIHSYLNNQKLN